jgi:hypothetical protein
VLNELSAAPSDVGPVLDDYHLADGPDLRDGTTFLLGDLPPHVHPVISSRTARSCRWLGWARGELVEVRAADLRFTPDEVATYLNDVIGLDLTPQRHARAVRGPVAGRRGPLRHREGPRRRRRVGVDPMMLLYLQLTLLRFAVPADAAAVRGASRPGAHRGHHEALGEHRGQLDTAAVIGPILGAGVATVITLVYQGLRRESETRARLVTELTAAHERLAATERRTGPSSSGTGWPVNSTTPAVWSARSPRRVG